MQDFFAIVLLCITFARALTTPNAASIPNGNVLTPPPPVAGQSVDQWIDQLFGSLDNSSSPNTTSQNAPVAGGKRDLSSERGSFTELQGLNELSWNNDTIKAGYNLTIDLSNSCTGLTFDSNIGVYTFTNGTTINDTKLQDMFEDLWSLAPTPDNPKRRWAAHTAQQAQLGLDEANQLLYGVGNASLVCPNQTTEAQTTALSITEDSNFLHNELRRLQASAWSFWTVALCTTFLGAGVGAGIAAAANHAFTGNITDMNVVQTAAVVGATIFLSALLNRQHEIGRLDRGAIVMQERAARGREILLQNAATAYFRGLVQRANQQRAQQYALSQVADIGGFSDLGSFSVDPQGGGLGTAAGDELGHLDDQTPGGGASVAGTGTSMQGTSMQGTSMQGTSMQGTPRGRNSGHWICLSDEEAAAAVEALGFMSDDELRIRTMETIQEAEINSRMENGEAGPSSRPPSSCDWASSEVSMVGKVKPSTGGDKDP